MRTALPTPTFDPDQVAEAEGIDVTYWGELPSLGLYLRVGGQGFIALHRELQQDKGLRRVVLAHELGHHMLHVGVFAERFACGPKQYWATLRTSHVEMQAERWAAERLVPVTLIHEMCMRCCQIGPEQITELAELTDVPESFLTWWLEDLRDRGVLGVSSSPHG